MSKKLKIGIVGCGAIGSSLAKVVVKDLADKAQLVALYDIDILKAKKISRSVGKNIAVNELSQLINKTNLVIESASADSACKIAKGALSAGCDIMIMSVGGIVGHYPELCSLARRYKTRVYIPSGAICGLDALKAAKLGSLKKVTLTSRKNPLSFRGVKYVEAKGTKLDKIKKDKLLFSGTAKAAVKYFPQNINVAAVLSLAGIGADKTRVKIIASPGVKKNIHEIQIQSAAGRVFTRTENITHPDNPKTSYLAVLSAVATLKQILAPVKVGT